VSPRTGRHPTGPTGQDGEERVWLWFWNLRSLKGLHGGRGSNGGDRGEGMTNREESTAFTGKPLPQWRPGNQRQGAKERQREAYGTG